MENGEMCSVIEGDGLVVVSLLINIVMPFADGWWSIGCMVDWMAVDWMQFWSMDQSFSRVIFLESAADWLVVCCYRSSRAHWPKKTRKIHIVKINKQHERQLKERRAVHEQSSRNEKKRMEGSVTIRDQTVGQSVAAERRAHQFGKNKNKEMICAI
jgi:hypothetical protein